MNTVVLGCRKTGWTGPQEVQRRSQQLPALRAIAAAAFAATAHTHRIRVGVRPPASLHLTIAEATAVPSSVTAFHAAASAFAITGIHHASGSSCDIGGFHLASAADLVLFDIESQPVANLGLAVHAVLDVKEDVTAFELDEAPTLYAVEGLDHSLTAPLGLSLVALALAFALHGHVIRYAAARDILGLLLTLPDIVLLNVKLHSVTRCWPAIHTVLDVDKDILPILGDEAPALDIVE